MRRLPFGVALTLFFAAAAQPLAAVDCTTIDGNLVPSCGFEDAGQVAAWFPNGGTPSFAPGLGETGNGVRGIAQDFAGLWVFAIKSPCFPVSPGLEYNLGYWVRLDLGAAPNCTAGWQQYSDPACSMPSGGAIGTQAVVPGGSFVEVRDTRIPAAGTAAMQLDIDCRTTSGVFEVLADNGYAYWYRPPTQEIPTLGGVGLAALVAALGLAAFFLLRRRRTA